MRYLSDEWLASADEAVRGIEPTGQPAIVGFIVAAGPDGERRYNLRLGPDHVAVERDGLPDVTLRLTWDLAVAIATGQTSAQRAVLDGQIRIGGDIRVLLGNTQELSTIDDRLAGLRAATEF